MYKNLIAQAQGGSGGSGVSNGGITNPAIGSLNNNTGVGFVQELIPSLISLAFLAGAILFFFMLLIGGIQWVTSGGDKGAVEAARGRIAQALVGIVVLFSVFAIIKLIEGFFGINILTLDINPLIIK
ncbi:MAG TPA: hypothetical protein VG895_04600 [Patescibacteria group bacterium]|nr:hypothetical protein [Patescibacteria group bacterium]